MTAIIFQKNPLPDHLKKELRIQILMPCFCIIHRTERKISSFYITSCVVISKSVEEMLVRKNEKNLQTFLLLSINRYTQNNYEMLNKQNVVKFKSLRIIKNHPFNLQEIYITILHEIHESS